LRVESESCKKDSSTLLLGTKDTSKDPNLKQMKEVTVVNSSRHDRTTCKQNENSQEACHSSAKGVDADERIPSKKYSPENFILKP
jgi:hypothetical protein